MGLKLNVVMWCDSVDPIKEYVQAGLGVGLFYRGSAEAGLREGYFKVIEIPRLKDIRVTYFVIYRKGYLFLPMDRTSSHSYASGQRSQ
jgi:DNA-binding transcriptional LysR family regulator